MITKIIIRMSKGIVPILIWALVVSIHSVSFAIPPEEEMFFNPSPEIQGSWIFYTQKLAWDKSTLKGYIPDFEGNLKSHPGVWRSGGANVCSGFWNGTYADTNGSSDPWRAINGVSLQNDISAWLNPPEGMTRTIKYSILQEFRDENDDVVLNNADIIEIDENQVEVLVMRGAKTSPPSGNLGIADPLMSYGAIVADMNVADFDFKADLAPDRFRYNHSWALSHQFVGASVVTPLVNQTAENIYCSLGKTGRFSSTGALLYGVHPYMASMGGILMWGTESGSGYAKPGTCAFDIGGAVSGEQFNAGGITLNPTNNRWWGSITIGGATYYMYLQDKDGSVKPYNSAKYPEDPAYPGDALKASGYPIRWHDDYELQLTCGLSLNVATYGTTGRYVAERTQNAYWKTHQAEVHEADVLCELRTYDPYGNADGPTSPYQWLYDASGNMYAPLPGYTPRPDIADPERRRAVELTGYHPFYPDDDTHAECEGDSGLDTTDSMIGANWQDGVLQRTVFEHAWRLAELMLYPDGSRPFEDLGYVWDTTKGCVAQQTTVQHDLVSLVGSAWLKLPTMYWDPVSMKWNFTTLAGDTDYCEAWGFLDHPVLTPVAGFEAIDNFIRYVFDIDALTVQDIDGDGHFTPGTDYILFSVRDDGLFTKMVGWDNNIFGPGVPFSTPFQGQFFDGDTVFLYDGSSVLTYFDPGTGIFFGQYVSDPLLSLWSGQPYEGFYVTYDLDGLDIGLVPEPSTMALIAGAGLGMGAFLARRRRSSTAGSCKKV